MVDLVKLSDIFFIEYGNQMDRNKLISSYDGVNFISRSSRNLGVTGKVEACYMTHPYETGLITVTLGGSLLFAFVQPAPFYTAQNIKVLRPLKNMTFNEKLFYCNVIAHNRFRYTSHGREANKTFDNILVPSFANIPYWVKGSRLPSPNRKPVIQKHIAFDPKNWMSFKYCDLFTIEKGKRLTKNKLDIGNTPFIGSIDSNNGYREYISQSPNHKANTITINYNGSVAEAFYQPAPFWASDDVNVLYPKFKMTQFIGLFIVSLVRLERYRFNYGRKWHVNRMKDSIIKLPATITGNPDWVKEFPRH